MAGTFTRQRAELAPADVPGDRFARLAWMVSAAAGGLTALAAAGVGLILVIGDKLLPGRRRDAIGDQYA